MTTTLSLNYEHAPEPKGLTFTIEPDDELAGHIRDHLPNYKARKDLQSQLDDNEHAIRRWIGEP